MIELTLPWPPSTPGIYKISDSKTGRFYIGSSVNVARRWRQHKQLLSRGAHPNPILQAVWRDDCNRLYIEVIQTCSDDRDELLHAEQSHLDASGVGTNRACMNVLALAGSHLGRRRSAETKAAMSKSQKGKIVSAETRLKQRSAKLGRKLSEDHRRKIGEASRGRPGPIHSSAALEAWRRYSRDQVNELRLLVASGTPLLTAAKLTGIARPTARRIIAGEAYVGV